MKICNWKRFITFIAIVILLLIVGLSQCSKKELQVKEVQEYKVQSGETYIVQKGDTIWGISTSVMKEKNIECDIRKVVYQIREDNNIKDCGNLQVGQVLYIRGAY